MADINPSVKQSMAEIFQGFEVLGKFILKK